MVPFDVAGSVLPVVLGWAPDRAQVELPATMEITGWLQPSEPAGDIDPDPTDNVMPQLRIASLTEHIDQDLYSAFVLTKTPRLPGLETVVPLNTPKISGLNSLRNLLYGIQWWIFGVFAVYVWVRWCRDQLAEARPSDSLVNPAGSS